MCDKQIPQHNYTIISIEGNIGAGKSTLLNYLKKEYPNLIFLDEPLDKWQSINHNPELNILQKYYENPKRWAYTFQIYAYQSRVIAWDQQIQAIISKSNKKHIFVTERSIESAREIFFKLCQEKGFINEIEYQVYDQFYQWFLSKNKQFNVDHFIYIETTPEECLRRINIRGRDEEKDIPLEYLQELHKKHVNWLGQTKNVVKLDGINNDRVFTNSNLGINEQINPKLIVNVIILCQYLLFIIYYFLMMISPQILDKLKPDDHYIIKPTNRTNSRSNKKPLNETARTPNQVDDAVSRFQQTLLSVASSKPSGSLSQNYGKRILLKSKGNPAIPITQMSNGRNKQTPPLISQSLPHLKYKTQFPKQEIPKMNGQISNSIHQQQIKSKDNQNDQQQQLYLIQQQQLQNKQEQQEQEQTLLEQEQQQHYQQYQQQLKEQQQQQQNNDEETNHIQCMVEQHLSEYEEYIKHLTGKCICVQCPCGRCKCNYQYHPFQSNLSKNSSYKTDFKQKPITEQDLKIYQQQFNEVKSVEQCDYKTTMSQDYKPYDVSVPESREKQQYKPTFGQTPISSYKNFYMDYGNLHYEQFKQNHYKTVIPELPFNSHTTYGQCFKLPDISETRLLKPPNGKPFPTIDLFLGQSSSKLAYPPKQLTNQKQQDHNNAVQPIPSYEGQYMSVTHSDYKKKEINCQRYKIDNNSQNK